MIYLTWVLLGLGVCGILYCAYKSFQEDTLKMYVILLACCFQFMDFTESQVNKLEKYYECKTVDKCVKEINV